MPDTQNKVSDNDCVICPACAQEFAAIPVNVQEKLARLEDAYGHACKLVADMHAAATGRPGEGPRVGVVEDVALVRKEAERLRGQRKVLVDLLGDAAGVLMTVIGESTEEEAALRALRDLIAEAAVEILRDQMQGTIEQAAARPPPSMGASDKNRRPTKLRNLAPGVYLVATTWNAFYIEVTPADDIYQLTPEAKTRDGRLSDEGWEPGCRVQSVVPVRGA